MKTIITLDRADSPYGFPQANEQGYLTSSKVSGPFGNDSIVSASYALTASFAMNGGGGTVDTSSLVTTASFNAFTASYNTGSFSGSFIGTFSGSLFGTASWAQSASVAISSSTSVSASYALSASAVISSSYSLSSSYALTSTPGGNDTQIQFNSGNTFAGDSSFTFNYASQSLQQGLNVAASGIYSHAEGSITKAIGEYSHAEGDNTQAKGNYSHAEGQETMTLASAEYSHAEGYGTAASAKWQHVQGQWNATSSVESAFIVGNGTDGNNRSNLIHAAGNEVQITGSLNAPSITGSLYGTASWAENAITASYVTGSIFTSTNPALSASYALTASYALNGGVTQLLAGANITLAPTNGLGQVTISSTAGGGSSFNTATGSYGSFYDTTTQTNIASTARSMSFNTTDITNGVSISGSTNPFNTYIKTTNAGVYDIQFSAQVDKTDSGTDEIWIWLRKNGSNLADTATSLQLVGNGAHYVAAWNWFVNSAANDYYQIMWYSPDANVRLHAESGFGVVPGIPSVIVTANRVDQFLSNTGSFSGSFTGQFTGSLFGTASWASNVASTGIVGDISRIATGSVTASVTPSQFSIVSGSTTEFTVTGTGVTMGSAATDTHSVTGSLGIQGLTTGSILFVTTSGVLTQNNTNLFWDNTNNRLGIRTNSPNAVLDVVGSTRIQGTTTIAPTANNNVIASTGYSLTSNNFQSLIDLAGTWNTTGTPTAIKLNINNTASNSGSLLMDLQVGGASRFSVDVSGSTRIQGSTTLLPVTNSFAISASGYYITGSNASSMVDLRGTWDTTGAPTALLLNITNTASQTTSKLVDFQLAGSSIFNITRQSLINITGTVNIGTSNTVITSLSGNGTGNENIFNNTQQNSSAVGIKNIYNVATQFTPASGTASFTTFNSAPTINQTGGANGITRGLFINPTLTSAADWRAIEVTTGSFIIGTSGSSAVVISGSTAIQSLTSQSPFQITSGSTSLLFVSSSGRIGIGTSTPTASLEIRKDNITNVLSDANGLVLSNNTAATASSQTQTPPYITLSGNQWGASAVNIPYKWRIRGESTQGSTQIDSFLYFDISKSGSAYNNVAYISNDRFGGSNIVTPGTLTAAGIAATSAGASFASTNTGANLNIVTVTGGSTITSGVRNYYHSAPGIGPSSGTGVTNGFVFEPTISPAAAASGSIVRGLFINPTITTAADFRAIEINSGSLVMADSYLASGSRSGSLVNLSQTWNTAGNVTGILYNVINTASGNSSLIFDFQIGGSSALRLIRNGAQLVGSSFTFSTGVISNNFTVGTLGDSSSSGNIINILSTRTFNPSSGNANFSAFGYTGTINQTSGALATGSATRGLFIDPTLTSAADFRAIETTRGRIIFSSAQFTGSVSQSSYFTITGSMRQPATTGSQIYAATVAPLITYTAPGQTNTAFRVLSTFTGSTALTASQQNIIADFGASAVGSQFVVNDVTSGSIYQVNDVSGLPIIEATSNWDVNIYDFPNVVFRKTGSAIIISGSLTMTPSSSFVLPLTASASPATGSAYWSGSFLFIYDGTQYRSASFA